MSSQTVLFEYRLPVSKKVTLWLILLVGGIIVFSLQLSTLITIVVLLGFELLLLFMLIGRVVGRIACTTEGIELKTVYGFNRHIPWSSIKVFGRSWAGFTKIEIAGEYSDEYYLLMPDEIRDKLISLLRETSNAYIIGFDIG